MAPSVCVCVWEDGRVGDVIAAGTRSLVERVKAQHDQGQRGASVRFVPLIGAVTGGQRCVLHTHNRPLPITHLCAVNQLVAKAPP